ncbi:hypothetical protein GJ744_007277 [Endocarpon pusillum]|uniref:Uncharacterized protein n=1 Tax=Endocarpon pusillum TaxID=364733 RepID=A0A8H7AIZ5_9EURO|nr:hypothetical protein GJ744_007277 [Endocarpon pusillum]
MPSEPGIENFDRLSCQSCSILPAPTLIKPSRPRQGFESSFGGKCTFRFLYVFCYLAQYVEEIALCLALGEGKAALAVEGDAAGTSIDQGTFLGDEAVQAHASAQITGGFGSEHGEGAIQVIGMSLDLDE